jgi:hypothetical protein
MNLPFNVRDSLEREPLRVATSSLCYISYEKSSSLNAPATTLQFLTIAARPLLGFFFFFFFPSFFYFFYFFFTFFLLFAVGWEFGMRWRLDLDLVSVLG